MLERVVGEGPRIRRPPERGKRARIDPQPREIRWKALGPHAVVIPGSERSAREFRRRKGTSEGGNDGSPRADLCESG